MKNVAKVLALAVMISGYFVAPVQADQGYPYADMQVIKTQHNFKTMWDRLEAAIGANKMGLVSRASASFGAASRDITIPGNAVFGVYRNDFAVRMLKASIPAGIEAPIRFYLTEGANGMTTLSYRLPSTIFKPYGSADLDKMAQELDVIFAKIAADASGS